MTNPTLITQDLTWAGWSVSDLIDNTLRPFGLTNDSTKNRVIATTDELGLARDSVRLAATYLNSKYPNVWARRSYTVAAWTSGDDSILLPVGVKYVERVMYGGLPLTSITTEDWTRFTQSDAEGGGYKTTNIKPMYYYISGIADADAVANGGSATGTPDWRMVLKLVNTPGSGFDTEELIVYYMARSPDFLAADDAKLVEFDPLFQDWLSQRATEIMAQKFGAARGIHDEAYAERIKIEETIFDFLEGTGELPNRVRWQYPPLADQERR
jgi:hypothetical protein